MSHLILHSFFRSSASVRVRTALNLKGLSYEYVAHHLRNGEHRTAGYLAINPQGFVPALGLPDGSVIPQSLAIIEYLDEIHPEPPLLPRDPKGRARVRALALAIACDIHPLNNLRVLNYLRATLGVDTDGVTRWFQYWVAEMFGSLENTLTQSPETGRFCAGDLPGLADVCLYAQCLNNKRFEVDMSPYPTINRIFVECSSLQAFADAAPDRQPDAE